jgi:SAM-dependent methyltransferase
MLFARLVFKSNFLARVVLDEPEPNMSNVFPAEFDAALYRDIHPDLCHLTEEGLAQHYHAFGIAEGRVASAVADRAAFVRLLPDVGTVLEIGPFFSPSAKGANVRYFDVFDTNELKKRAEAYGADPDSCPNIDYVSPDNSLSSIRERFSATLSCHCIEHQPDLVRHLKEVGDILDPNGCYFVVIPDKRYTFDHFRHPSTIADVLGAHLVKRIFHDPASILEYRLLRTHNDSGRHWMEDHGRAIIEENADELIPAIEEASHSSEHYIDTHAWHFTPRSFRDVIEYLRRAKLCKLEILRIYPTVRPSNEFYVVLGKQ